MLVWYSGRLWSAFLLAGFNMILFHGVEDWNQNAFQWLEKYQINLDADILVAKYKVKRSAFSWYHNLWDLMLGASCGLEVSETVLTNYRNPDETKEVMTSGSSKDVSNTGVSVESMRIESKCCSKSATAWSRNE